MATGLNNLAELLSDTNRLAEAEPLYRRALAITERSFGLEHPNVARGLNNLAGLLSDTNRLAEAEPLYRRALAIYENSFGPEHPDVARGLNNLAELLSATNRLAEAEPLLRRALAIDEKSLGPEHPTVANSLNSLAGLYRTIGAYAKAEPLYQQALQIRKKALGADHPSTAAILNNLAALLQDTNRLQEAGYHLDEAILLKKDPTPVTPLLDENVQFTVYRPREIIPVRWYKMLIFTHLDERPAWLDASEPSPLEEVQDEAQRILGPRLETYRKTTEESRLAVPREGEITLVPEMQGIEFNPPTRSFSWKDGLCLHLETFELRAGPDFSAPTVVRGRVTIFLGHLILAEVALSIRVIQTQGSGTLARPPSESSSARRFRRIFASYSHKDLEIVKEMERYSLSLGDRYLRDWVDLRAGERWNERLLGMITEADIFQLFWSWNSSQSSYVEREWRHALALRRETFIRPTYWEDPWPPPPEPLFPIQFVRLPERPREEKERLEAEPRQREEKERLEAEQRQREEKERLEAERRAREEQERLEAERRAKEQHDRLEAQRGEREADKPSAETPKVFYPLPPKPTEPEREKPPPSSLGGTKGKSPSKHVISFLAIAAVLVVGGLTYLGIRVSQSPPPQLLAGLAAGNSDHVDQKYGFITDTRSPAVQAIRRPGVTVAAGSAGCHEGQSVGKQLRDEICACGWHPSAIQRLGYAGAGL